ncbi:DUF2165 family protein [Ruegeria atlantica]|uniref:DUF2165 family protein n=1 Tax=Ruegeria atlantica TaxID=81569 RepID=UPI00147EA692|nr:DUF2165 family protein [Ruegeria atlantica]
MSSTIFQPIALMCLTGGLACWTTLAALNNLRSFRHGVGYMGFIMGMSAVNLPDTPANPLTSRAVHSSALHKAALGVIILTEVCVSTLLWAAAAGVVIHIFSDGPELAAMQTVYVSLIAFMSLAFLLLVSGSWFAYYTHMEQSQIMHFIMIGTALLGLNLI